MTVAGPAVRVRDDDTHLVLAQRTVAAGPITALAATADGEFIVVGDNSGGVGRFDAGTLAPVGTWLRLDRRVVAVAAGPAATAVVLLDDSTYTVVDLAEGEVVHRGSTIVAATSATVSPDGGRLAIGGAHGEVGLLDLSSQQWILAPMPNQREFVDGMSFSADGRTLVTSTFDGDVRLWDGTTGVPIGGVQAGENSPAVAIMLPDGRAAVVATRDGAVYRLSTDVDSWLGFACAVAGRNLTAQEWRDTFGDEAFRTTCPTR